MSEFSSETLRDHLIVIGERIRDLCSSRLPEKLGHYTGSQLRMITRIYNMTRSSDSGIQLKNLAAVLNITPAATSEMVETLVRRGALERRVDAHDRRAMALRLAPEFEQYFRDAEKYIAVLLERFFVSAPENDRQAAQKVLHDLSEFLLTQERPGRIK